MEKAILLAIMASFCTATSSVCQRLGAQDSDAAHFDVRLAFRLARRPIWLAGIASMILGFFFQLTALHFGALALVQPILALELLFVFGYMAALHSRQIRRRDWLAAIAMSAGLGLFLFAASPSGGRSHAPAQLWLLAGVAALGAVLACLAVAFGLGRAEARRLGRSLARVAELRSQRGSGGPSSARRAAVLGAATGLSWGFVAAVIKEFSSHLDGGAGAIFSNWSVYVLIGAGAASLLVATHALAAGPLAASQPGFTIVDPLAASLLGMFLFGEHMQANVLALATEAAALALLLTGVMTLSHSHLVQGEPEQAAAAARPDSRYLGGWTNG